MYWFLSALLLSTTVLSFNAYSSPTGSCSVKALEDALVSHGMPPTISTHIELEGYVESQYGQAAVELLKKEHVALDMPGALDAKTVQWFSQLRKAHGDVFTRYVTVPFPQQSASSYIQALVHNFAGGIPAMTPVFTSQKQLDDFLGVVAHHSDAIKADLKGRYNLSDEAAEAYFQKFHDHYITGKNYKIGFHEISASNPQPVVHVSGYTAIGDNGIAGPSGAQVSPLSLTNTLLESRLKPDSTIKLDFCFQGCQSAPLKFNTAQVKKAVYSQNIDHILGVVEETFLSNLYTSIKRAYPGFQGKVSGYWGERLGYKDGVLFLDGSYGKGQAAKVTTADGDLLLSEHATSVEVSHRKRFEVDEEHASTTIQTMIPPSEIRYLDMKNGQYLISNLTSLRKKAPPSDGLYIFIVPEGAPGLVLLYPISKVTDGTGHVSLSRGKPVHFAGEIQFLEGEVAHWNNSSGHYKATSDALLSLPELLELLSKDRYQNYDARNLKVSSYGDY